MQWKWVIQELSPEALQGLEDGDEMEAAAKVTLELQIRNYECVCPEHPTKKRESNHLCQVLLLNQDE